MPAGQQVSNPPDRVLRVAQRLLGNAGLSPEMRATIEANVRKMREKQEQSHNPKEEDHACQE